jgi:Ca-activated chloride channel family protein
MTFLWPELLWLLATIPLFAAAYIWLLRRRKRAYARYANLGLVKEAMSGGPRLRRHLPPALFLLALALMIAAVARPAAIVMVPTQQETIILAMDVSGSMRAKDIEPTRLAAMQAAARTFVSGLPRTVRVGVVSFAGTAAVVQQPTHAREDVIAAIDRFQLQRGTAIGSGILVALATIFPDQGIEVNDLGTRRNAARPVPLPGDAARKDLKKDVKPVPPGSHAGAAIILLTDGQRTAGPETMLAAKTAAERGVRVFTVGFGTPAGVVLGFEGWSFRARLDEDALKAVANATRGEYFRAGSANELAKVYEMLNARIVFEKKEMEITAFFAAAAAAVALVAAALSMLWFGRIL